MYIHKRQWTNYTKYSNITPILKVVYQHIICSLKGCLKWGITMHISLLKLSETVCKLFSHWRKECWYAFPILCTFRMSKLTSWLAIHVTSSFMHMIHQVSQTTCCFSFSQQFWLILLWNLSHWADFCAEPAGFSGILWFSSAEIYHVNKLPAFVLVMQIMHCFPFIYIYEASSKSLRFSLIFFLFCFSK